MELFSEYRALLLHQLVGGLGGGRNLALLAPNEGLTSAPGLGRVPRLPLK